MLQRYGAAVQSLSENHWWPAAHPGNISGVRTGHPLKMSSFIQNKICSPVLYRCMYFSLLLSVNKGLCLNGLGNGLIVKGTEEDEGVDRVEGRNSAMKSCIPYWTLAFNYFRYTKIGQLIRLNNTLKQTLSMLQTSHEVAPSYCTYEKRSCRLISHIQSMGLWQI